MGISVPQLDSTANRLFNAEVPGKEDLYLKVTKPVWQAWPQFDKAIYVGDKEIWPEGSCADWAPGVRIYRFRPYSENTRGYSIYVQKDIRWNKVKIEVLDKFRSALASALFHDGTNLPDYGDTSYKFGFPPMRPPRH